MKSFLPLLCISIYLIAQATSLCDDSAYMNYLHAYPSKCDNDCTEYKRLYFV